MPLSVDVDQCIETLKQGEIISECDMRKLCQLVSDLLMEENNVQPVHSPVTIVGDLHGQFFDFLEMLNVGGWPPHTSYVFLGDFVDRGHNSVETMSLLLCLKLKYPGHITLLRGNHESRQITQVYGFYDECMRKYGNASVWRHCVECFDCFGLGAIIDQRVFCVHGGLSPDIRTLDQIRAIDRNQEIPHEGAFCDLVWSDPEDLGGGTGVGGSGGSAWQISPRGAGYLFGQSVTEEFNSINSLELIARAHQLVMEGRKYQFDKSLVTVWSAPNYCYRCGNVAAILELGEPNQYLHAASKLFNNNNTTPTSEQQPSSSSSQSPPTRLQNGESHHAQGETVTSKETDSSDDEDGDKASSVGVNGESTDQQQGEHEGKEGSIPQRFAIFEATEHSMYGPKGESRSQLVPYFL